MQFSILSRATFWKLAATLLMAAQTLGWIPSAQADPGTTATQSIDPDSIVECRRALREFDRFLDHNPLLEDELRVDPQLTTSQVFLGKTPELRDFFSTNPLVYEGLKIYPRYFLNRALMRHASLPLSFANLAPLKELFLQQPELQKALTKTPESIRDPAFLDSHPALFAVIRQHRALAEAFLPASALSAK